jgi:hypothetical protein
MRLAFPPPCAGSSDTAGPGRHRAAICRLLAAPRALSLGIHSGGIAMKIMMLGLFAAMIAATPAAPQDPPAVAKSVQLSKVILNTEGGIKGKIKGGTLCVFPSKWQAPEDKKTQDYERYDQLFSSRMKASGYDVVSVSGDLFADDEDRNKADFLVGAVIHPDTINLCSSVNGEKGDMTVDVDWQIYDRATHQVVATAKTEGQSRQEKFAQDGLNEMFNRAFLANLDALLAQGALQKYTGTPVAPAAAESAADPGVGSKP